jgi:uncharacterized protein HemX
MVGFIAQVPKEVLDAGGQAADTLTKSVLGSLVVLFVIATGAAIWLAWKSKQSELDSIKQMMAAQNEKELKAQQFDQAQNELYKDVAKAVGDATKSIDKLGRRIDTLAATIPGVDPKKYYEGRE